MNSLQKDATMGWDPEVYRTVKLSPFKKSWLYFKLYRFLDLESLLHLILDRVRVRRLRVVHALKGYDVKTMEQNYDIYLQESDQARRGEAPTT